MYDHFLSVNVYKPAYILGHFSMAKSKAQRMREYREKKKQRYGEEWPKKENQRIKSYFVPVAELSEEKRQHKRKLNKVHCATYRKKRKMNADKDHEVHHLTHQTDSHPLNTASTSDEYDISSTTTEGSGK